MKYHLTQLIAEYHQNPNIDYLFFWGHQPAKNGEISKSCFSQWWEEVFEVNGIVYKTAEHWMMSEKAKLFEDQATFDKIIPCSSPAEAKKLGREILNFDPHIWDKHKYEIVKMGNIHKFSQNPKLKTFLFQTGQKVLVEASPYDQIWGIGMKEDHLNAQNPTAWKGENLLGFALMEVREELMKN